MPAPLFLRRNHPPKVSGLEQTIGRLAIDTTHLNTVMTTLQTTSIRPGTGVQQPVVSVGLERRVAALESQFLSNRELITRQLLQFSKLISLTLTCLLRLPCVQYQWTRLRGLHS